MVYVGLPTGNLRKHERDIPVTMSKVVEWESTVVAEASSQEALQSAINAPTGPSD